jgi:hypothetical protein
MPKTIEGGPWDYLPVLNECIRILLTVAVGILSGYFKVFNADSFVPQAIKFIFNVSGHFPSRNECIRLLTMDRQRILECFRR